MTTETTEVTAGTISGLYFYPIKSCAPTTVSQVTLDAQGIANDRRWMAVRAEDGRFLTQREYSLMACIHPTITADGLTIDAPEMPSLVVPFQPDAALARRVVSVWKFTGEAVDEGDTAASWLSDLFGFPCRLVRTPDDFTRRVNPDHSRSEDRVGFADGYPLLFASESSLADLNARLIAKGAPPVPMERFRPNLVVSGLPAWAEDHSAQLRLPTSGATFRMPKPCARCAVITIDQQTGTKTGPEPLATLATFRRDAENKVLFGVNLIPNYEAGAITLRVGDGVTLGPLPLAPSPAEQGRGDQKGLLH